MTREPSQAICWAVNRFRCIDGTPMLWPVRASAARALLGLRACQTSPDDSQCDVRAQALKTQPTDDDVTPPALMGDRVLLRFLGPATTAVRFEIRRFDFGLMSRGLMTGSMCRGRRAIGIGRDLMRCCRSMKASNEYWCANDTHNHRRSCRCSDRCCQVLEAKRLSCPKESQ